MDIGKEAPAIVIEPLEIPVPGHEPVKAPVPVEPAPPERPKVKPEREKVPA